MIIPPFNFCGLEDEYCNYDDASIVIVPVPFEKSTSWIKGTCKGPEAIIDASRFMELYDIDTDSEVYKNGIHTSESIRAINENNLIDVLSKRINKYLDDRKFPVILGGEHTVTIGTVKAIIERQEELSVLILDAHSDFRDEFEDNIYSHACVSKRISEMGVNPVQVGIRSIDKSELKHINLENIFFAKDIYFNNEGWVNDVIRKLKDNIYISIDLDVFDPSVIPSVGTPEPGGLIWYDVIKLLKEVIKYKNVIALDIVELCPNNFKYSDFTAAKLIYTILSHIFNERAKS